MTNSSKQNLLSAYLIVGEDELKRRTVIERLRKRMEQFGDLDFNHDQFNGESATGSAIVDACNTLPFASEMRLVEVTDVEKLSKADADALVSYLEAPCESTLLALIGEKLAKNTRLYKAVSAVGAKAVIDCAPMKRSELANAVRSMAVSHGFTLEPDAASLLVDLVGEDTVALDSELKKLSSAHTSNQPVSAEEVQALVARVSESKPWEFTDAFAARNAAKCIRLRKRLESVSPYALQAMCVTRIRELICAKSLVERGEGRNLATVLKCQPWRVKNHLRWASAFSMAELEHAIVSARDAEQAMKSGADPETAFMDWVLGVIAR